MTEQRIYRALINFEIDQRGAQAAQAIAKQIGDAFGATSQAVQRSSADMAAATAAAAQRTKAAATVALNEERAIFEELKRYQSDFGIPDVAQAAQGFSGFSGAGGRTPDQLIALSKKFEGVGQTVAEADEKFENLNKAVDETSRGIRRGKWRNGKSESVDEAVKEGVSEINRQVQGISTSVIGSHLASTGAALQRAIQPLIDLPQKYVGFAGMGDEVSREWLESSRDIEQSTMRIAREFASELLPIMKEVAKLADNAADFVEANPWIAKGIALLAGGTFALGSILGPIGGIMTMMPVLKSAGSLLGIGGGVASGAAAAGAATTGAVVGGSLVAIVASTTTAVLSLLGLGALLGMLGFEGLRTSAANATGKSKDEIAPGLGTYASVAAGQSMRAVGGFLGASQEEIEYKVKAVTVAIGKLTGVLSDEEVAAAKAGLATQRVAEGLNEIYSEPAVNAFISYKEQQADAEERYEEQRLDIIEQYGEQRTDLERRIEEQRNEIIKNFNDSIADLDKEYSESNKEYEQDYQEKRIEVTREYHETLEDLENEHRKRLEQIERDYQERKESAIAKRDALALSQANRDREREIQEENEQYAEERKEAKKAYLKQLNEMEQQFSEEQQKRQEEYQTRLQELDDQKAEELAKLDEQYAEELNKLEENKTKTLKELDDQYAKESKKREEAFKKQLAQLGVFHGALEEQWAGFYANMQEQLGQFIEDMEEQATETSDDYSDAGAKNAQSGNGSDGSSGTGSGLHEEGNGLKGGRLDGGYVWAGNWSLHDDEYVMSPETTKSAERLLGGNLTQSSLLGAMAAGRGHGRTDYSVSPNQQFTFNGSFSFDEMERIKEMVEQATDDGIYNAVRLMRKDNNR